MSGLTPLIDTLLHQVLGKRVDLPASRPLNPPVMPLLPAEAARAVHSDSRLDARLPQGLPGVLPGGEKAGDPRQARGQLPAAPQLPPSAVATLSPAARTIADVLLRHPAQPSVVSPSAPLLDAGNAAAAPLADRLQQSINSSGLFYESHLARWHRGEMPLQALAREPQFWSALTTATAAGSSAAAAPQERPSALLQLLFPRATAGLPAGGLADETALRTAAAQTERSSTLLQSLIPRPPPAASAASEAAAPALAAEDSAEAAAPAPRRAIDTLRQQLSEEGWSPPAQLKDAAAMKDLLQGLVRHQLELLVAPVLRWEGQVWPGIFLALQIHAPHDDEAAAQQREAEAGEAEAEWQAQFSVKLERLGSMDMSLRWRGDKLNLLVSSPSDELLVGLERDRQALCERLQACGFAEVELRALKIVDEEQASGE